MQARTLDIGPGRAFADVAVAAAASRNGDTLRIFPGRQSACAVLRADDLTIEGAGEAREVVLAGRICQGKAILVDEGKRLTLRNLTLAEARSVDGNGAGLRAEGGDVTVEGVRFIHDQDGILTSDTASDMVLLVRDSLFEQDGACVRACAHGIYAGHIARLAVAGSVFRDTQEGHAIKSRARRTEVEGCDIADGPQGTGSYLIEAPNGGTILIRANTLEKGPHTGNSVAIAIGLEGIDQPTPFVSIQDNRFKNDSGRAAVFVRNASPVSLDLRSNKLTGWVH